MDVAIAMLKDTVLPEEGLGRAYVVDIDGASDYTNAFLADGLSGVIRPRWGKREVLFNPDATEGGVWGEGTSYVRNVGRSTFRAPPHPVKNPESHIQP